MKLTDCGASIFGDSSGRNGPPAALLWTDLAGKLHEPPTWKREGDTLETLTLSPSIDASSHDHRGHKGWHGHVAAGEVSP